MEWLYTIGAYTSEPVMMINKSIGSSIEDIDGMQFEREIRELEALGPECIHIYINSPGGDVDHGFSIFSSIYSCKCNTITYNIGRCYSIASIILQAGKKRIVYEHANTMIHDPFYRNKEDLSESEVKILDIYRESVLTMLMARTNKSKKSLSKLMSKETWLNSSECLKIELCDEILTYTDNSDEVEDLDYENDSEAVYDAMSFKILNQIKINTQKMSKIQNLKAIFESDNKEEIINTIMTAYPSIKVEEVKTEIKNEEVIDEVKNEEMSTAEMSNEVKNEEEVIDDVKNEEEVMDIENSKDLEILKAENAKLKAELKAVKTSQIENYIETALNEGRIELSTKQLWINAAHSDFESVKALISNMEVKNIRKGNDKIEKLLGSDESKNATNAKIENWKNMDINAISKMNITSIFK